MTYSEAADTLRNEFGLELIEAIEQVQSNLDNDIPTAPQVIEAYGMLMSGFRRLIG